MLDQLAGVCLLTGPVTVVGYWPLKFYRAKQIRSGYLVNGNIFISIIGFEKTVGISYFRSIVDHHKNDNSDFLVFALINFKNLLITDPARSANKFSLCDQIYTKLFGSRNKN